MMDNEEGTDVIEGILRTKEILLPAIVLLEVYSKTIQKRGMEIAEIRYATLRSIKAKHIAELTEPVLLKAGEFKVEHQISLADSIIAAYAFIYDATLVHKDHEYEVLTMVNQVKLTYKPKRERKGTMNKVPRLFYSWSWWKRGHLYFQKEYLNVIPEK